MSLRSCAMFAAIRNNETNKIVEIPVPTNRRKPLLASNNFNHLRCVPLSEMSNMRYDDFTSALAVVGELTLLA
jgi:hypothetical protein